ncbi:hypothetical protein SAMN06265348_11012 [Pedobacter westerhofensis]|uniref:Uncharacterized protein n=1 Tax=Pedobacter westerhofensis TaxID=425512 RepID=A0A521F1E1_9SPHI|nr:hypothetical protein [Pedobacter westerhofensis]SMO90018.1 hypothetical protein SAMN06265348_11012 [Pedobacter westerhofensis]
MYRRDLLTAEIQKLAQALARLMGLKQEGKLEEADKGIDELLENDFGILFTDVLNSSLEDFELFLQQKDFAAEKLDFFSQLLYLKFSTVNLTKENRSLAHKLKLIYQILEIKHHVVNMISIGRQKSIEQYLNLNS